MDVMTRLYIMDEENEKFFGEGPYRLLKQVEQDGSLHAAAYALGMAYSKATRLIKQAEKSLGFPLTVRKIGGKSGGGSVLTREAKDFLIRYEAFRSECVTYNKELFQIYFGNEKYKKETMGCVIMASGLGKRFGGDKLMAELGGRPMIQYILETTEGLFAKRVVVTRNEKVREYCKDRQIPVLYHTMPDRNDTVRLGIESLEVGAERLTGCMFCPADMPFVSRDSLRVMLAMAGEKMDGIYRLSYGEKESAPVLFGSDYLEDLKRLPKGKGGSVIIKRNLDKVSLVQAHAECELWDVDTKEDYEKAKTEMKKRF